ncbi:MAG: synthase, Delta/Epsilon chain, beta-sandwich domain [Candidatus Parcubacteria bacterium]|jgi:F-type H+-transporting ATPase subunit epsilon
MITQATFHLVIASVGETRFDGAALFATLPGAAGEMTILAHHEPIVTTLAKGTITIRDASGATMRFDIAQGVFEMSANRAVVLL